jgi:type I restriction enzyme R subunit
LVFEVELIRQIEINIDYILLLVKKYHDTHCTDKEVLITIQKAIDASPELRSKKALIETFIAGINDVDDVMAEWHDYVAEERERQLMEIVTTEKLKEAETRKFLENAFRDGEIRTTGTDIDKIMPPVSRFGGGGARAKKKQSVINKLKAFFEKYFGIGGSAKFTEVCTTSPFGVQQNIDASEDHKTVTYDFTPAPTLKVAEESAHYGKKPEDK